MGTKAIAVNRSLSESEAKPSFCVHRAAKHGVPLDCLSLSSDTRIINYMTMTSTGGDFILADSHMHIHMSYASVEHGFI